MKQRSDFCTTLVLCRHMYLYSVKYTKAILLIWSIFSTWSVPICMLRFIYDIPYRLQDICYCNCAHMYLFHMYARHSVRLPVCPSISSWLPVIVCRYLRIDLVLVGHMGIQCLVGIFPFQVSTFGDGHNFSLLVFCTNLLIKGEISSILVEYSF